MLLYVDVLVYITCFLCQQQVVQPTNAEIHSSSPVKHLFLSLSFPASDMDYRLVFSTLNEACEDTIAALCAPEEDLPYGEVVERITTCIREIQRHATALEPVVTSLTNVYHHYDFDEETPGNGYRTLVKV